MAPMVAVQAARSLERMVEKTIVVGRGGGVGVLLVVVWCW